MSTRNTSPLQLPEDPRVPAVVAAVKKLSGRSRRHVSVQDYNAYARLHPELPAMNTVYRIFGKWPHVLEAAGLEQTESRTRAPKEELVADLRFAAEQLGVTVLSTHAYDEFRRHTRRRLYSSSVIRKWFTTWELAVQAAGLGAPKRSAVRRVPPSLVLSALQQAVRDLGDDLTPQGYDAWAAAQAQGQGTGEREVPRLAQVMMTFPTWEQALRSAEVERADDLHPHALWTAEEADRIVQSAERVLKRPLDEAGYERLRSQSRRPLPSWTTLQELLERRRGRRPRY